MAKQKTDDAPDAGPPPTIAPPPPKTTGGTGPESSGAPRGRPAGQGPLPRVIDQLERAGKGQTRYKVRGEWPEGCSGPLYVLAEEGDQKGAVTCYLRSRDLASKPDVKTVVTELSD